MCVSKSLTLIPVERRIIPILAHQGYSFLTFGPRAR